MLKLIFHINFDEKKLIFHSLKNIKSDKNSVCLKAAAKKLNNENNLMILLS